MAVHDPEEFDVGYITECKREWYEECHEDDCAAAPGPEIIRVRFKVRDGRVSGSVIEDVRGKARAKIVFLARTWLGPQPKNDEELSVLVVHETKKEEPRKGVLFVVRFLPVIDHGGQYGRCGYCKEFEVPLFDYTPLGVNEYGCKLERSHLRQTSCCEKCGTLHKICLPQY